MFSASQKTLIFLLIVTILITSIAPTQYVTMWMVAPVIIGILLVVSKHLNLFLTGFTNTLCYYKIGVMFSQDKAFLYEPDFKNWNARQSYGN